MQFKRKPLAMAISLGLLTVAGTVSAQEVTQDKGALETVTVTATKRSEPAYKIPFNISAISEDQLREQNITDIKKLLAQSEAISAPENSARFTDNVTVRGLNTGNANANNLEMFVRSTMAYYLDDTPLPFIGFRIKDLARVETLIGPQGTLYGAGSLGGTIRYITNKPQFGKTEGRVNVSLYQTRFGGLSNDTDAVINLPLGERFALRASYASLDEKGYTDRVTNRAWQPTPAWNGTPDANRTRYEDDDWQKVNGGRVALRWKLTPDVDLTLSHAEQDQKAHGSNGATMVGTAFDVKAPYRINDHTIISPNEEFARRKFRMDAIDLDWALSFATLHSSTGVYRDTKLGQGDYTGYGDAFYGWIDPSLAVDDPAFNGYTATVGFDNLYKGLSHETRLTSSLPGPLQWVGGLYHSKATKQLKFSEIVPGFDATGWAAADADRMTNEGYRETGRSEYSETALFGELSYKLNDRWSVTAGARVFSYQDDAYTKVRDYAGTTSRETTVSVDDSGRSYYKLNTSYQLTPGLLGYVTYSQGFRRGGANGFRDYKTFTVEPTTQNYQPDSTDNFELGLKGYLLDKRLYGQLAIYQIKWNDPQVGFDQTIDDFFPINGIANGADGRSRGFELSTRYRLNENWQVTYSTTYTNAEFTEDKVVNLYTNSDLDQESFSKGTKMWGAPKWKHNLGVRYDRYLDSGHTVSANLRGRYAGEIEWNGDGDLYPSYTLYSAGINLSKDAWDIGFWVDNLTDDRAVVSNQSNGGIGRRLILAKPRTVGLNLSYKFM